MQEEGSNSASEEEELNEQSEGLLGGQTGENPPSDSQATEANADKKERNEDAVTIGKKIETEKEEGQAPVPSPNLAQKTGNNGK